MQRHATGLVDVACLRLTLLEVLLECGQARRELVGLRQAYIEAKSAISLLLQLSKDLWSGDLMRFQA